MVNDAETTATNAEKTTRNDPGMCLQWSRERAGIGSYYPDAATAWRNTNDRHPGDRKPPRGSMAFWTGGSNGFGHVAPGVGGGEVEVRSTDAAGQGYVNTVDVGWPERAWGMTYAGWAWDVNETTIPHSSGEGDDMPTYFHVSRPDGLAIPAKAWKSIKWTNKITDDDDIHKTGDSSIHLGGKLYNSTMFVALSGLKAGAAIRTRSVEGEFNSDGAWVPSETNRSIEQSAADTSPSVVDNRQGRVASGKRIRFEIYSDVAVTLTSADLVITYW